MNTGADKFLLNTELATDHTYDGSDGRGYRQIHSQAGGCRPQAYAAKWFSQANAAEQCVDSQRVGREDCLGLATATHRTHHALTHHGRFHLAAERTPATHRGQPR